MDAQCIFWSLIHSLNHCGSLAPIYWQLSGLLSQDISTELSEMDGWGNVAYAAAAQYSACFIRQRMSRDNHQGTKMKSYSMQQ